MAKTNEELAEKINGNVPAQTRTRSLSAAENIRNTLTKLKGRMEQSMPKHIDLDRLYRIVVTCFGSNPKLYGCTTESVCKSVLESSALGLFPGLLGEAYLIPYKDKCTFIIGYRGMMKLARNSGEIGGMYAVPVFEKDFFKVYYGSDPRIEHELAEGERGELKGFYAVAKFKDGAVQFDWMTKKEVDAIRARSKAANDGPWVTDYIEMGKKTVMKRLCKYLPLSTDVAEAFEGDAAREFQETNTIEPGDISIEIPEEEETINADSTPIEQ